jgi:hypothetical protein
MKKPARVLSAVVGLLVEMYDIGFKLLQNQCEVNHAMMTGESIWAKTFCLYSVFHYLILQKKF